MKSRNRKTAVRLVKMGLHVQPLNGAGQKPTTQMKVVEKWWKQWADAPIGVLVGAERGVVAVSVCGKEGRRSWNVITRQFGRLPATLVIEAPDEKIYLFASGDLDHVDRLELLQGVSVLGDNKTVECVGGTEQEPRKFAKGKGPAKVSLAPMPGWLSMSIKKGEQLDVRSLRILPVDEIEVGSDRRPVQKAQVEEISRSLQTIGLKTPITVRKVGRERYILVAGLHRLEAAKLLGWKKIQCIVLLGDETDAERWEISENFHRAELTALERAEALAKWADSTSIAQDERNSTKTGRPAGPNMKAASKIVMPGKSVKAKREHIARSRKIAGLPEKVKKAASKAGLDTNQAALLKVAATPRHKQLARIAEIAGRATGGIGQKSRDLRSAKVKVSPSDKLKKLRKGWLKAKLLKTAWEKAKPDVRKRFIVEIMGFSQPTTA